VDRFLSVPYPLGNVDPLGNVAMLTAAPAHRTVVGRHSFLIPSDLLLGRSSEVDAAQRLVISGLFSGIYTCGNVRTASADAGTDAAPRSSPRVGCCRS
jgi:hypothetical protein